MGSTLRAAFIHFTPMEFYSVGVFFVSNFAHAITEETVVVEFLDMLIQSEINQYSIHFYNQKTMKNFYRVTAQGEPFYVQSQKAEGGQVSMCNIVLQELGGKYENSYVATMFGEQARVRFSPGELVAAALRFSTREYSGQMYQDVVVNEIVKLNK